MRDNVAHKSIYFHRRIFADIRAVALKSDETRGNLDVHLCCFHSSLPKD